MNFEHVVKKNEKINHNDAFSFRIMNYALHPYKSR
jgi:hypothetical protein